MNCRSRNSRPTGPKMRVPRGAPWLLIRTAALSSNLMWLPSGRPYSCAVRTTTARTTSPFLTAAFGCACFTVAIIVSPTPPYLRPEPPSTRMHRSSFAPLLSATRSRDSCWITLLLLFAICGSTPLDLHTPLDDFANDPSLPLGQRPGLLDPDNVPRFAGILLVVSEKFARARNALVIQRMAAHGVDR